MSLVGNIDSGSKTELALDFSKKLNQLIISYREKTILMSNLLEQQDDDSVFQIEELLDQRETIIKQYETLKQEYQQLVSAKMTESEKQELNKLAELRIETLLTIEKQDSTNQDKINKLYINLKEKVHKLSDSKKMLNVYHAIHPLAEGVYFDKRK